MDDKRFDIENLSEEVNLRNVLSAIEFTRQTRTLVDRLETKVDTLTNEVSTLRELVTNLTQQVGILRGELYKGGPTG